MRYLQRFNMALLILSTSAVAQNSTHHFDGPAWVAEPTTLTSPASDTTPPSVRTLRSKLYNSPVGVRLDVDQPADSRPQVSGGSYTSYGVNFLPVHADAIVIGKAVSHQAFLSEDHRRVYSDLTFLPTDVIKVSTDRQVQDQPFIVSQGAGTAILPSGKVVTSMPYGGTTTLTIGVPYLLFLTYHNAEQTYTVQQAWLLSDGKPVALDANGLPVSPSTLADLGQTQPVSTSDLRVLLDQRISAAKEGK